MPLNLLIELPSLRQSIAMSLLCNGYGYAACPAAMTFRTAQPEDALPRWLGWATVFPARRPPQVSRSGHPHQHGWTGELATHLDRTGERALDGGVDQHRLLSGLGRVTADQHSEVAHGRTGVDQLGVDDHEPLQAAGGHKRTRRGLLDTDTGHQNVLRIGTTL